MSIENGRKTLTDCLEHTASAMPDKIMFLDEHGEITFGDFTDRARRIGCVLHGYTCDRAGGVAVIVDKSIRTPLTYAAVLYAGSFYMPIDAALPPARKKQLLEIADAPLLLIAAQGQDAEELDFPGLTLTWEYLLSRADAMNERKGREGNVGTSVCDPQAGADGNDPLCVIFTSGSTGTPKGVTLSHASVLRYLTDFAFVVGLGADDRLASQSPPDYVAALRDLYFPFICGASACLIPKGIFSFPAELFKYLNAYRVTALFWVAPVLSYCAEFAAFDAVKLSTVNKIVFTGSVLPAAHLRYWQQHLPDALFINHYGPTEATATISYYIVDHTVSENEHLPIGAPMPAAGVELVDEDGHIVTKRGEIGEIYVRGDGLAIGYWRDPVLTEKTFPEFMSADGKRKRYFRTGDMGSLLPDGNLAFHGRRDSLVKLMGHRIELAEIDNAAMRLAGVEEAICIYEPARSLLVLFYRGTATSGDLAKSLRKMLPDFMIPRRFCGIDNMPRLPGGKPDMRTLRDLARDA
jgi:amino acid adenylation domain-containing protein